MHKVNMDIDPGYKFIGKLRGGVQWYLIKQKILLQFLAMS